MHHNVDSLTPRSASWGGGTLMHRVSTSDCPFGLVAPPSPVEKVSALGRHLAPHYELVKNNNRGSDATNSSILQLHHTSSVISQPSFLGEAWAAQDGRNGKNIGPNWTQNYYFDLGAAWAAQVGIPRIVLLHVHNCNIHCNIIMY